MIFSNLLYYGANLTLCAGIAKWYGGRLENGYAQACRGSNPFPGVHTIIKYSFYEWHNLKTIKKFSIDELCKNVCSNERTILVFVQMNIFQLYTSTVKYIQSELK